MGLSSYGKYNKNIPSLIKKAQGNPLFFSLAPPQDSIFNPTFSKTPPSLIPPFDRLDISQEEKDIAWKIQNDSQESVKYLIQKSLDELKLKKVCLVGGYALNCVTNYFLKNNFPDVEFYFEPIANDTGTAIGAAKLAWHSKTQDMTIRPFKSLYLGKQYSKEELLEGIKKYLDIPQ